MTYFLPKFFLSKGTRLRPCWECGSEEIIGHDAGSDGFFTIKCHQCGIAAVGAFGESAAQRWNEKEKDNFFSKDGPSGARNFFEYLTAKADARGVIGGWDER